MLANEEFKQDSPSFDSLLHPAHLTADAYHLFVTHTLPLEHAQPIWQWCDLHLKRNMPRAQVMLLNHLPSSLNGIPVSLLPAENAVREAEKLGRAQEQAEIEVTKMLHETERCLEGGLPERAKALARNASTLSKEHKLQDDSLRRATTLLDGAYTQGILRNPISRAVLIV